jgi:hypothetical protein
MKRHKHADLIIAWANGAEIQKLDEDWHTEWFTIETPTWDEHTEYRLAPVKQPDKKAFFTTSGSYSGRNYELADDDLMLIFDGVTGKLKEAVILK